MTTEPINLTSTVRERVETTTKVVGSERVSKDIELTLDTGEKPTTDQRGNFRKKGIQKICPYSKKKTNTRVLNRTEIRGVTGRVMTDKKTDTRTIRLPKRKRSFGVDKAPSRPVTRTTTLVYTMTVDLPLYVFGTVPVSVNRNKCIIK